MKEKIELAKIVAITSLLDKLNIKPARNTPKDAHYLSPLRKEETASFHVDKVKNLYYDFGAGKGGDVIKFAKEYLAYTCEDNTLFDALRWIEKMSGGLSDSVPVVIDDLPKTEDQSQLTLKSVELLADLRLIRYLEDRKIDVKIAKANLKEVTVFNTITKKTILALGLPNESEGYELSNQRFKSSVKEKDISLIRGRNAFSGILHIYEGKTDFLSNLTRMKAKQIKNDVIVLNSVSLLQRAIDHIQHVNGLDVVNKKEAARYKKVYSWFDNDDAGQAAKKSLDEFLKTMPCITHMPMDFIYKNYNDVNEWHVANPIPKMGG